MSPDHCARCGNDGLLIKARDGWLCSECFFWGQGKRWPMPKVVPFRPNRPMRED